MGPGVEIGAEIERKRFHPPVAERFWRKVDRRGPNECWPWLGAVGRGGYGIFQRSTAQRFAFEDANGPIPDGADVRQTCLTRLCCNPGHLVASSRAETLAAAAARGAFARPLIAQVDNGQHGKARRDYCRAGHPYSPGRGKRRVCLECRRIRRVGRLEKWEAF